MASTKPIARRANQEEACTGRFWEGRYNCQAILVEAPALSCMSYAELNLIPAGVAENLETSVHTRAINRIPAVRTNAGSTKQSLASINASLSPDFLPITTEDYVDLID